MYFYSSLWAKRKHMQILCGCHVIAYSWHLVPQTPPTREGLVASG